MICQQMTQVITRNRIDAYTGVAADGALWNEEQVPPDAFFLSGLQPIKARCDKLDRDGAELVQIVGNRCAFFVAGGKISVGRGLCSLQLREESH
jgi:CRISPR/Cas system CMR subunit Cmr4 (Cas7 group RAMP superfamily)